MRPRLEPTVAIAALLALLVPSTAAADPLIPGPAHAGHDAALAAKIGRFDKQIHGILTVSLGWGLEAFVSDPAARDQIDGFVASDADTFEDYAGQHIYAVLDRYEEFGDLGMFGGVQAAGDAMRYAVLRDEGADPAAIDAARADLLAAMDGLHWYSRVTGTPGVIARGLRRVQPQPGAPALPDVIPATVPLFDAGGDPQPADKQPTWRADVSGELPHLIWLDDTSKDQFIGYVFALGAVYDVVAEDEAIPAELVDRLAADARALAQSLMQERRINGHTIDLVLVDADGRPTSFFDIGAEVVTPDLIQSGAVNPFNAAMALGAMRTLYQITGDEDIGRYYYEELIEERGYLDLALESLGLLYFGYGTNHSNVNMAFVSIYGLLRYEPEMDIAPVVRELLETQLYGRDPDRSARGLRQSLFDFMVAGFGTGGITGLGEAALADGLATLVGHPDAPYWDPAVENCDAAEISAGACTAIDGSPITLAAGLGWNDTVVAEAPLPIELRPPSNFTWRSDPHGVNGGGTTRLNPGGGIWCAYWLGRFLSAGDDGLANISPLARGRPMEPEPPGADSTGGSGDPSGDGGTGPATGSSTDDAGAVTDATSGSPTANSGGDGGCGCTALPTPRLAWLLVPALFALGRRRSSRRSGRRGQAGRALPDRS